MNYITHMLRTTSNALDRLYRDLDEVIFTDFPDYPNIGDSAIALGNLKYWHAHGIRVDSIYSLTTLAGRVYSSKIPVVINGGGNIGGLYPPISAHRYSLAERMPKDTLLIQAPQSVSFVSDLDRQDFRRTMASRELLRVAVRDTASLEAIQPMVGETVLAPDSAHMLGPIQSDPPSQRVVYLARRDEESNTAGQWRDVDPVDWPRDRPMTAARTWARWRAWRLAPRFRGALNASPDDWANLAAKRFQRGVSVLAKGEVIVTDRLHAMILGLQLGRPVVAIDNSNHKLSNYAKTWFESSQPDLSFVRTVGEARKAVDRLRAG